MSVDYGINLGSTGAASFSFEPRSATCSPSILRKHSYTPGSLSSMLVCRCGWLQELTAEGDVILQDGERIPAVDVVIFCTGALC